ncbi:MAG: beta-propeller fold lactonase family protein, partial [Planctomycetes bacterium]|nr:beta-propeller fold lactonase family protein [Planctomycetota bacterium]
LTFSPDSKFLYVADPKGSGQGAGGATGSIFCFRISDNDGLKLVQSHTGQDKCFTGTRGLTIHPNGKTVYVPSSTRGLLTVLDRDLQTGKLTVRQILKDGENNIQSLNGVYSVACTRDGKFLYSCSGRFQGDQAVSVFKVADDGSLSLVQELFNGQTGLHNCRGANEIHISPDGKHVCVAATVSGYVIDFQRDEKTGKLHDAESMKLCDEEGLLGPAGLGISPDGRYLYTALEGAGEIAVLRFIDKK